MFNIPHIDIDKLLGQLIYNPADPLLFNSGFFLFFMLFFLLIYQFLYKHKVSRILFFTVASLYFFYKACGFYFLLIVIAAVVDFNLSNWIYRAKKTSSKKGLLIFSIIINLGVLVYFKYTNFFIEIVNGFNAGKLQPLNLILPIGISFYTFENLSYTIDVYRGKFKPVTSFLDYCFFLSFFPKLVMGPIVRASDFIPQIRKDIFITNEDIGKGLYLIMAGLFKKVVISDYIYLNYVENIFDNPQMHSGLECLLGVYGYALVIYCDFSGYSDMAIGMARWMGFTIPPNFDSPYQSSSITEFWRRWHISLSSWLKDYLYISLGGNKKGKIRLYINLMITMLLGGLWHGASWNFIIWGGLHGAALSLDKFVSSKFRVSGSEFRVSSSELEHKTRNPKLKTGLLRTAGVLFTFHFVCFCWIFFKASTLSDSLIIIKQIAYNFDFSGWEKLVIAYKSVLLVILLGYVLHFIPQKFELKTEWLFSKITFAGRVAVLIFIIWVVIQVKSAEQVMPIYLQF